MNACGKRIEKLHREIAAYLAFIAIAREEDSFWREYSAWKSLTERISDYSAE